MAIDGVNLDYKVKVNYILGTLRYWHVIGGMSAITRNGSIDTDVRNARDPLFKIFAIELCVTLTIHL